MIMRMPLGEVLDSNTKNMVKAWLGCFRHSEDIYVDIDGYRMEFTVADDKGHTQRLTIPSSYLENSCRMYRIDDLLGVDKNE